MDLSVVRRRLEDQEASLSPYACRVVHSRGRDRPEEPSPTRTDFQRDRDRILHTNAFRRLKHKTQVFIAPTGDHYVTRLTHTLEVAQIARTIARALNLNEDLVEATALGHDLGHTPFGHIGEAALDQLFPGGFQHSLQSLRTVEVLEKDGLGLNLTWEVRQGIAAHSKPRGDFLAQIPEEDLTLEAQVVRLSDAVAYLNHDIGDAIRAGILREEDLPQEAREVLGTRHAQRIDTMVSDIVATSWAATGEAATPSGQPPNIAMSPAVGQALVTLREFLFQRVYLPTGRSTEGNVAHAVVELLYAHLCAHPKEVPQEYLQREEPLTQAVADYLAGMTDQFALRMAERIKPGIAAAMLQ